MHTPTPTLTPKPTAYRRPGSRTGNWQLTTGNFPSAFTFAEVLFAVMLLGIGFIMVAAIFPVAIRQQQSSMEDTAGVATAKRAASLIQQMGNSFAQYNKDANDATYGNYNNLAQDDPAKIYPAGAAITPPKSSPVLIRFQFVPTHTGPTGTAPAPVAPYRNIKGDLIQPSDRRIAWIPVAYASALGSSYANVYLVAVQSRANDQFTDDDRDNSESTTIGGPFAPVDCNFKLVEGDTSPTGINYPDTIVFTDTSGNPVDQPAAAEGAFVWVADDNVTATPAYPNDYAVPGAANGRHYRLGVQRTDLGTGVWELQPGADMTVSLATAGPDNVWFTADDTKKNENLPPRIIDLPAPAASTSGVAYATLPGTPARGLLVGRGRERTSTTTYGNYAGNAMPLYALPPISVRIRP